MPQALFTTPTPADVHQLVARMRAQDIAEVRAAGYDALLPVIEDGIERSAMCWSAHVDGELACIFGCAPAGTLLHPIGVPWLLGTDVIQRHRRIFVRLARPYIAQMLAAYPTLMNAVHVDNAVAVRWLRSAGFTLGPAVTVRSGALFHPFTMSR